jgi:hypothetical protein
MRVAAHVCDAHVPHTTCAHAQCVVVRSAQPCLNRSALSEGATSLPRSLLLGHRRGRGRVAVDARPPTPAQLSVFVEAACSRRTVNVSGRLCAAMQDCWLTCCSPPVAKCDTWPPSASCRTKLVLWRAGRRVLWRAGRRVLRPPRARARGRGTCRPRPRRSLRGCVLSPRSTLRRRASFPCASATPCASSWDNSSP